MSSKWSLLVVQALEDGSQRSSELQRGTPGVSQKVLTQTLRHLERDGVLTRAVAPAVPVRTDYELTTMGQSLMDVVRALRRWSYDHMDEITAARGRFDAR